MFEHLFQKLFRLRQNSFKSRIASRWSDCPMFTAYEIGRSHVQRKFYCITNPETLAVILLTASSLFSANILKAVCGSAIIGKQAVLTVGPFGFCLSRTLSHPNCSYQGGDAQSGYKRSDCKHSDQTLAIGHFATKCPPWEDSQVLMKVSFKKLIFHEISKVLFDFNSIVIVFTACGTCGRQNHFVDSANWTIADLRENFSAQRAIVLGCFFKPPLSSHLPNMADMLAVWMKPLSLSFPVNNKLSLADLSSNRETV